VRRCVRFPASAVKALSLLQKGRANSEEAYLCYKAEGVDDPALTPDALSMTPRFPAPHATGESDNPKDYRDCLPATETSLGNGPQTRYHEQTASAHAIKEQPGWCVGFPNMATIPAAPERNDLKDSGRLPATVNPLRLVRDGTPRNSFIVNGFI
jgi:hypothetical protein